MNDEYYKFTKYSKSQQETRWADINEIKANTSFIKITDKNYSAAGLPIISDGNNVWVDNTDTHSLIFGSTGSKKSRLFCMPMINIMAGAGESFVVTDPKGELFDHTSGFVNDHGYNVVVLNYRDLNFGDTWNPLALPYELYHSGYTDDAVARINDFVNVISEPLTKNTKDLFWVNAARSVATAILLLMLDECSEEECNLKTFTRFCVEFSKTTDNFMFNIPNGSTNDDNKNYLTLLMNEADNENIAYLNYFGISGSSDKARGDIQSTLFTLIQVFMTQDKLIRNMSSNSFDVRKIGKEKTAIYIIVPDEKSTYHFIATTFVKQCYETLIQEAQNNKSRKLDIRVNFVLDEFANLPALPDMPSMITAARSRNMRFFLVIQSVHQLEKKYNDDAQTIKGNCDNWVFLASKEVLLLEEVSKLSGKLHYGDNFEYETPLISISQLQRLNKQRGEALVFNCRQYPIISELADIDEYSFKKTKPFEMSKISSKLPISISPKKMYEDIKNGIKHIPFK
ncbi:type IV secretory system conjugative DNA transfer family protein [Sedimentibacter sp. zth1]|uniref:VirD4-like conjugal transfer protein, CD1115 family n=1 Tax=Sedimentibacter sp. zth1 TaxID=2816908 RepID=UPI001A91BD28|nr:type IV secretory system conjugative DNA transfer family protein [Sedimentibacter sp. zth1]QSX06958.1 type IV secretory system conjugative DNA transfer family protein [Sedimentibacter sp. zth1]